MTTFTRQFFNPAILFEREDLSAAVLLVIVMQVDFLSLLVNSQSPLLLQTRAPTFSRYAEYC
jgi:hypothetical protein